MAKTIVMNPPAELERRDSDVAIPAERFLKFSLFARLAKKPTVERFPGTLIVRRFRQGEIICRQGESGWTAFYLLTTEDVLELRKEQLDSAHGASEGRALQAEVEQLQKRRAEFESEPDNRAPRAAAMVHLASARPSRSGAGGWLERLARTVLPRPKQTADRRPLYIPIDAPTDVSYDSRQAILYEGDLFGEQSCLYGTPRSATIVAERDCYVLEMLRNILDQIQGDKAYRAEMDAVYKTRILQDHLRNLPLFSDLTEEQLAGLRDSVDLIRCKDGQLIYDEYDRSDGLYVIRSGLVKVMKNVSSLLAEDDVLAWPKLRAFMGDATAAVVALLPERVRAAAAEVPPAEIIAALNEIIKDARLPEAAPLRELVSPALSEFSKGKNLPENHADWPELDRRRYNRLLLEVVCPATFRKRQPPDGPETVLLVEDDVLDWPTLRAILGYATAAALAHLRSLLPARVRAAAVEVPQAEIIAALNEIIKDARLPEAAPLRELVSPALSEFSQQLPVKRADWAELDRRRYNRLLLEAACPATFRKRQRPTGPETVLAYLGRGEVVGEMGVMDHQPRTATCVAYVHPRPEGPGPDGGKWRREVEHVELVRISDQTFWHLLDAVPTLHPKMKQLIAHRKQNEQRIQVRTGEDSSEGLLSGRAAELGLIQGQKMMLIDLDRCTRCDECVQACVNTHDDGRSRLFLDGPRFGKYLVPTTCRACLDPVCMIGCPVGSIHRGDNRQIVIEDWCIGCGFCATNCPYGSIQMHDIGIIPASTHGWRYLPEKKAGKGWQRRRHNDRQWLAASSPFADDSDLRHLLERYDFRDGHAVCFRYAFQLEARLLASAGAYKLEVTSADESATVWLNGDKLATPAEKPKRGKREYLLTGEKNPLRRGRNVVAVRVVPPPYAPGKKLALLEVRMDEVRVPDVPPELRGSMEITEKEVTDLAVVCDQCSSQWGQRPACVTACPHDAAMRVDARFNFPVT